MWAIYVVFLLIQCARGHIRYRELLQARKSLYGLLLLVICSLFLLTSWPLFQYSQHRQLLLGSSNSGGTLYSGLGQLPDNPWNRIFADKSATDYARSQGIQNAWGLEGNKVLTRRFLQDVSEHPLAFLAKMLYNQLRILTGGFYTAELRTLSVRRDPEKDEEQKALFAQYRKDIPSLFQDILALKAHTYAMLSQLVLKILSILLLLGLLGTLLFLIARRERSLYNPYVWMIAGQFLTIGVYVYQPRQISVVVILFLFALYSMRPVGPPKEAGLTPPGLHSVRASG